MKTSTNSRKTITPTDPFGFTLLELLMAIAVISTVVAVGIFAITGMTESVRASKLHSDVATLNNAVRTYLTHGGTFAGGADGQAVIDELKSVADANSKRRLAGLRNSMIDGRLRGKPATGSGTERAVWNSVKERFELATSGNGFSSFDLEGVPPAVETEEQRAGTMKLAMKSKWVWDSFGDASPARATPDAPRTKAMANIEAPPPATITRLAVPDVSMPGALYDFSAYSPNLTVSLRDRNPPGVAQILYSIDNGPWKIYTKPLNIPPVYLYTLRTYAGALDVEFYEDSDMRTEKYETIYFSGVSDGNFYSPAGDADLVTNLTGRLKLPDFTWGTPAGKGNKQNELEFKGAKFTKVGPDEEFELGTLSYYNGTTQSGTNATSVKILIDLNLTEPAALKEPLSFTFNLLSTPNKGKSDDEDADYVYIPNVSSNFSTVIKGKTFALVLRFGDHTKDGFTTIDTFHAHENKTLTGTIYGRLTEVSGKL